MTTMYRRARRATEHDHQVSLFQWAATAMRALPALRLMYAIPNAGKRSIGAARYMISEGLKKGVPDICLPVARGSHIGMYIEMKSATGRVSDEQGEWMKWLADAGHHCVVCRDWLEARAAIVAYLELPSPAGKQQL